MGALDLPSEADEPGRADRAGDGRADRPQSREMPEPDERGRVYEATRARGYAETPGEAEPGRGPDGPETGNYWAEVPRFLDRWADHQQRWPADRQLAADYSDDPAGSYRSQGGFYLSPERHTDTITAIGRMCDAEPAISADMKRVEQENRSGGSLEGFEFRLKGDDRLKEKVAERLESEPDKTPADILRNVPDAVRFTFCLPQETYSQGYYDIREQAENSGCQIYESRNSWDAAEYKGINTRWVTPEGQRFEIQFHTPESFHAKHYVTHKAYERLRNLQTTDAERIELKAFQREVCSFVEVPEGARNIPDFKKEIF